MIEQESSTEHHSEQAEQAHAQAQQWHKQKDYQQALHYYAQALQLDPANVMIHYNLGLLFSEHGYLDAAITQFNNVLNLFPAAIPAHFQLGNLYLQQDQPDQAIEHFQPVIEAQPEHLEAINNLGVAWLKKQDVPTAMTYFAKVLQINEEHKEARSNLAAAFLNQNQYIQAIHHYKTLVELEPSHVEGHYNLGVAFMSIGQLESAIVHFQQALQLNTNYLDAHLNLGAIYLKQQQQEQALYHYQRALELQPGHPTASYMQTAITQRDLPETAPLAYVKDLFDSYANHYDQHMLEVLEYQVPQQIQKAIKIHTKAKDLHVWDLGCGTGLTGAAVKAYCQHLTGVDLSQKMLDYARQKAIYDELITADVVQALTAAAAPIDVLLAAEVFIYTGNLQTLLTACQRALKLNGILIFTVEISTEQAYYLQTTGRFAHSMAYLQAMAKQTGFTWLDCQTIRIRLQDNEPQLGYLVILQRTA